MASLKREQGVPVGTGYVAASVSLGVRTSVRPKGVYAHCICVIKCVQLCMLV